jgi:hypothetical protein
MRESQMKKLVALAVAGAFVAPVYAANISVSGEVEFTYTTTTGTDPVMNSAENAIQVTAKEEINGIAITAAVIMDEDANFDGGRGDGGSLSMKFANGLALGFGDQSGAMDSVGDYTDVSPVFGGFAGDGGDHGIKLTFPSFNGVTAFLSHSPKTSSDGTTPDVISYAVKYNFGAGEVYYGAEQLATAEENSYGVKYTFAGVTLAYEIGNDNNGTAADQRETGVSLSYKMGDIFLGLEKQTMRVDGAAAYSNNDTVMFAEYNLGSAVDIYLATTSSSLANGPDATAVGIEYSF